MLKAIMFQRFSAALVLVLMAVSPLFAQPRPLSFCLVQTKPHASTQYDPSAGPWAVALYTLLSAQTLRSGAPLRITALAAESEKDVVPEVEPGAELTAVVEWRLIFGRGEAQSEIHSSERKRDAWVLSGWRSRWGCHRAGSDRHG